MSQAVVLPAGATHADAESRAWSEFVAPSSLNAFYQSWLDLLCSKVEGVRAGLLIMSDELSRDFQISAVWSREGKSARNLTDMAEKTLSRREGLIEKLPDTNIAYAGYPLELGDNLLGAVVLDVDWSAGSDLRDVLRDIHWGVAWLIDRARHNEVINIQNRFDRLSEVSDLLAVCLQESSFKASSLALVNELSTRFGCDRVSLGMERSGQIRVEALSNAARFDRKTLLVNQLRDAMEETLDHEELILISECDDAIKQGAVAHEELRKSLSSVAVCSVPLVDAGCVVGVLILEKPQGEAFSEEQVVLFESAGKMLGPILMLSQRNDLGVLQRTRMSLRRGMHAVFGPSHPGIRLLFLCLASLGLFLGFFQYEYRVAAKAHLQGAIQHAVVTPFDGFIAEAPVRAGDQVQEGDLLFNLQDRELKLEQIRWASEKAQAERRFRLALADQDPSGMRIAQSQIDQAQSQLALADDQLERANLRAPFDGLVVSGDLSQRLGSPVQMGDVLFEIAPLDSYRVVLEVNEADIAHLQVGQKGWLSLSGLPGERIPLEVQKLTPVSVAEGGHNFFRVEASLLEKDNNALRPGMEGIGKIETGERSLFWILTHRISNWFSLAFWKWMP